MAQRVKYMATCAIALTFLVVIFVLIPLAGLNSAVDKLFTEAKLYHHFLCPLIACLSFVILEKQPELRFKDTLYALIPTAVYAVIMTILNILRAVEGPYPFFKVYEQSVFISCVWFVVILGAAYGIAVGVYFLNKVKKRSEQTMIIYREAKKSEIKKIAELVATSFGQYPMYTLTFRDKSKTKDDFIRYMKKLNRVHIGVNARKHKCFVGVVDRKIVSVALLQNPNIKCISLFDYILAGGVGLLFPVGFKRLIGFFDISNEAHKDCAEKCGDAWYVELLAVSPD